MLWRRAAAEINNCRRLSYSSGDKTQQPVHERGISLTRLRKEVVFDRLLARLLRVAPHRWLLKGALALDFRLEERARTTMDLDSDKLIPIRPNATFLGRPPTTWMITSCFRY